MAATARRRIACCSAALIALTSVTVAASAHAATRSTQAAASTSYDAAIWQESRVTTRYGDSLAVELCFPAHGTTRAPGRFPVVAGLIYTSQAGANPCSAQMAYIKAGYI